MQITPEDYEKEVLCWLSNASGKGKVELCLSHRQKVEGHGGDYEIDIVGEFSLLGGAAMRILVECKRHRRPVERDAVLAFANKIQDTDSQKGMMFSTAGFQQGAIEFAESRRIALVTFVDGKFNYETRSIRTNQEASGWVDFPRYGGVFLTMNGIAIGIRSVGFDELDPIVEWIKA